MTPQNPHYDIAYRIDSICLQFADQLRQSTTGADRPSIESLLQQHSDLPRQQLLECLLSEELEYLTVQGQKPDANRLRQRFPQDHAIIDKALSRNPVKQAVPDECATQLAPADAASEGSQPKKKHPRVSTPAPHISGFDMLEGLGEGGMGAVFQAYDRRYKRTVAIKIIHRKHQANPQIKLRFENEIFALKRLSHANIVRVHESGEKDEVLYYSMDYVDGLNLELLIRAAQQAVNQRRNTATAMTPHQAADSTLPPDPASAPLIRKGSSSGNHKSAEGAIEYPSEDFIRFCTQRSRTENHKATKDIVQIGIDVANAMQHAHDAGVIHRDLKPNNLLLDKNGRIWVADFGLAQAQDATPLTMTGHVHGTLKYMSPEQLLGGQVSIDRCTDMYSLGATLYELLCLEPVREGNNSQEIRNKVAFGEPVSLRRRNPAIPRDLETIIHKAISHRPRDRYQTMQELSDDLRRFQRHEPILAKPAGPLKRLSLWVEREQKLAASLAASAALLLVILGLLLVLQSTSKRWVETRLQFQIAEKQRVDKQLLESEANRLVTTSLLLSSRNDDPTLAMLLAAEASKLAHTPDTNAAMIHAMRNIHELRRIDISDVRDHVAGFCVHPGGDRLVTYASHSQIKSNVSFPAHEVDIKSGAIVRSHASTGAVINAVWTPSGRQLVTVDVKYLPESTENVKLSVYYHTSQQSKTLLHTFTFPKERLHSLDRPWPVLVPETKDSFAVLSTGSSLLLLPLNPAAGSSKPVDFSGVLQTVCLLRPRPENPHGLIAAADLNGQFKVIDLQTFTVRAVFSIDSIVQRGSPVKIAETSRGLLLVASNRGSGIVDLNGKLQSPTWPETGFHLENGGSHAMFYGITAGAVRRNLNSATETHRIQHNLPVRAAISLPESGTVIVNTLMNELFAYSIGSQNSRRLISNQRMHLVQLEPLQGTSCLTLSPTGQLSVLSTRSMSELRSVEDSLLNAPGASPVFSDDGTLLAAPLLPESITETYALTQTDTVTPGHTQKGTISHRRPHPSITASHDKNLLYLAERGRSNREHSTFVLPFQIRESQPLTSSKLLLVSTSGEARLFDSTTEDLVTLGTDNLATTDFDLHIGSDTTKMILTSERGSVILHDTTSETTTQLLLRAPAIGISFSPDGTSAVCADRAGTIHLLSCASLTLEHISQIVLPIQTAITSIEHSPDGSTVLLTCGDEVENVQTLDAKTLSRRATATLTKPGKAVWISNEEVVATSDFGFYRWQIKGSGESLTQVRTAAVRSITSSGSLLAWVEKESLPYSVASNSAVSPQPLSHTETFSAFSMDTRTRIVAKHQTSALPMSVHFDHAGQTLQVSGYTYSYCICRTSDMTQVESPKTRHANPTILMRFLPDSHTLFLVSGDGSCCTWTPEDGGKTQRHAPTTSLIHAAVSSQRTHLLTVDSGNQGRVYQLPNCIEIPIPGLKKNVTQLAISSDNQKLYSLLTNGELRQTKITPEIVHPESTLITTGVVSAQPFPENSRLLLITRSANTGGPLSLALLDTETGTETAIGDSLKPVKASLAASGDQILLLTDDQRFLKLTLQRSDGKWIVPDDSVAELATGVLYFNCPGDSPFAVILTRDATRFLALQESRSDFVIPFSGTLANESTTRWDKASSSQNGLWFAVPGKNLECWPAELQNYVESNAGRQLTVAERKRYAIRDDLKN